MSDYATKHQPRDMPSLPKQVLFVRHGQGVHNLEGGDKESPDPAVRQTNRQPAMHSLQPASADRVTLSVLFHGWCS